MSSSYPVADAITLYDPAKVAYDQRECLLCRDEIVRGERITELFCRHIFHKTCFDQLCCNRSTCCICFADVIGLLSLRDAIQTLKEPLSIFERKEVVEDHLEEYRGQCERQIKSRLEYFGIEEARFYFELRLMQISFLGRILPQVASTDPEVRKKAANEYAFCLSKLIVQFLLVKKVINDRAEFYNALVDELICTCLTTYVNNWVNLFLLPRRMREWRSDEHQRAITQFYLDVKKRVLDDDRVYVAFKTRIECYLRYIAEKAQATFGHLSRFRLLSLAYVYEYRNRFSVEESNSIDSIMRISTLCSYGKTYLPLEEAIASNSLFQKQIKNYQVCKRYDSVIRVIIPTLCTSILVASLFWIMMKGTRNS